MENRAARRAFTDYREEFVARRCDHDSLLFHLRATDAQSVSALGKRDARMEKRNGYWII